MNQFIKTMRWYGPQDSVSLRDLRECGIEGIVTALHHIPPGEVWPVEAIAERQTLIRKEGLEWLVVESLPVHEDIKKGATTASKRLQNYRQSLRNLAACGIRTVAYNFMPVLDWVRTHHFAPNPDGTSALAYRHPAFVYFDVHLLKRPFAAEGYTQQELTEATRYGATATESEKQALFREALLGLPGSDRNFTATEVLALLEEYKEVTEERLRQNLVNFLSEVVPTAEETGVRLAIHPDDPPFSVLGLPRIVSRTEDLDFIFSQVGALSNGLCFCSGSLGARADNDLQAVLDRYAERIHFVHLRNVAQEEGRSFREAGHLLGDLPMAKIVSSLAEIMARRGVRLPMRPDHGFLHTRDASSGSYPGYSLTGRLKGLAELDGLCEGLSYRVGLLQEM